MGNFLLFYRYISGRRVVDEVGGRLMLLMRFTNFFQTKSNSLDTDIGMPTRTLFSNVNTYLPIGGPRLRVITIVLP